MTMKLFQNQWVKAVTESLPSSLDKKLPSFFFYLTILFLPTQFGKHFWPFFAFVLGQRVDYLSPTLYTTDIFILLLFVNALWKRKFSIPPTFILFALFLSLTIFQSVSPWAGWYGLLKFLEFSFFGWYVATQYFSSKIVAILLSVGIVFESTLALMQYAGQSSIGGILYFLGERTFSASTPGIANTSVAGQLLLRPYGTFPHPNVLGGYLFLSLLLCFLFLKKQTMWQKVFLGLVSSMAAVGILFSFSRTIIFLGTIFLCTGILFIKRISPKTKIVALVSLALGMGCAFVVMPHVFERLISLSSDDSLLYRVKLSQNSMQLILAHPLLGVGLNNFLPALPTVAQDIVFLQPVHNIFLLTAVEIGLPGFLFVVGMSLSVIARFVKIWIKHPHRYLPLLFCLIAIVGIGMLDHYFLTLQQGQLLLSLVVGILLRVINKNPVVQ